ncbi:TPA: HTH domain-containing protein, partial [Klebsiella pneumoniae]
LSFLDGKSLEPQSETKVSTLCQELGITRQTLYRHISPVGQLRADGIKLLNRG